MFLKNKTDGVTTQTEYYTPGVYSFYEKKSSSVVYRHMLMVGTPDTITNSQKTIKFILAYSNTPVSFLGLENKNTSFGDYTSETTDATNTTATTRMYFLIKEFLELHYKVKELSEFHINDQVHRELYFVINYLNSFGPQLHSPQPRPQPMLRQNHVNSNSHASAA